MTAGPSVADVTLFGENAIKEDEAHHAADVEHHDEEDEAGHDQYGDERSDEGGINVGKSLCGEMTRGATLMRNAEVGREIKTAAGAHLARKQANESESRPLPEAKGLNELTLRVLEGERNRVHGRDWQSSPLNSQEKGTANGDAGQIDFWSFPL